MSKQDRYYERDLKEAKEIYEKLVNSLLLELDLYKMNGK